jgi:eukaryotic-like serine/threonine-protein kinase
MEMGLRARDQNPASLKVGTRIGPWRVVAWRGQGTYGAVYLVVREGDVQAIPYALKMALHARDKRFQREVELLSRTRHPNVPRLYGQGEWECALGVFPYFVMEWVEGVALYDWSSQRNITSRQAMELVAQLAGALAAIQAEGGVHRDVKGDNVLVRLADGRPYLVDFGSGAVEGAEVLTREILPPGTEAYRSPEAWAYQRFNVFQVRAHYEASASDDLFALGVMAYRLVTDEYPPPTQPEEEGAEVWQWDGKGPRPPSALNPQVCEELDALILRLLASSPSKRFNGNPGEAAKAAERAVGAAGPKADELLFAWETQPASEREVGRDPVSQQLGHRPRRRDAEVVRRAKELDASAKVEWERQEAQEQKRAQAPTEKNGAGFPVRRLLVAVAALALLLVVGVDWRPNSHQRWESPAVAQRHPGQNSEGIDGGPSRLGESMASVAPKEEIPSYGAPGFSAKVPKTPLAGQRRAPCKERQIEILGGCWYEAPARVKPPCDEGTYEWEGMCYMPILIGAQRGPTSEEP